jgi:hypothetical protein
LYGNFDVALHDIVLEPSSNQTLDREQGITRVGDGLPLRRLPHQHLVIRGERDDGRRGAPALGVLDDARLTAFQDRHAGIRGSQIDSDDFCHEWVAPDS